MKTLSRLIILMSPFRWWIIAAVLLSFATVGSSIGLMAVSAYLISKAALASDPTQLGVAIAGVRLFALARALLRYVERVISHTATFRILTHLRTWFYSAIEPLAPARLQQLRGGDLMSIIVSDIETLEQFYIRVVIPPFSAVLVIVLATLFLGSFGPSLGLALLVFLLLTGILLPLVSRTLSRQPAAELITARAHLNASLLDGLQGIADLIAFGQNKQFQESIVQQSHKLEQIHTKLARVRGLSRGLAALLTSFAGLTVLIIAIPLVTTHKIDGVFLALLPLVAIASFEAVQPLSQALTVLDSSHAAAHRLFELIDAPPAVTDPHPAVVAPASTDIEFRNISFRYSAEDPLVLDRISFSVAQGQRLALVGPSGSGKTTIINLLLRFWDYEQGQIKLGGSQLREIQAEDVRKSISVISQNTHIFNSTIRDNLYLARPDATDAELLHACQQAQIDHFISQLPLGFDTSTGEHGLLLSGGERQRLAIARAVLKDAPILLLDEATANLDPHTEKEIWLALDRLMNGRTSIIISHRPEVLPKVDQIVHL